MPLNSTLSVADFHKPEFEFAHRGMRSPAVITLKVGDILYRLGSTKDKHGAMLSAARRMVSPWWMLPADYDLIVRTHRLGVARQGPDALDLGFTARSAAAIQQSYSKVDVVVSARVLADINAFIGPGRTQHREMAPNGMYITMPGWADIRQLFIPGITDRNGATPMLAKALAHRFETNIPSQQLY